MTGFRHKTIEHQNNQIEKYKDQRYKKYGITKNDYDKLLKEQNNCCAICGIHIIEFKKSLFIDHCHKSGKVRGLLCPSCNTGLSYVERKTWLKRAKIYLKNQ